MHLETLFQLYLEQSKKRVLTLCDNERTIACQWIKKIELAPNPEEHLKKLQLHSIKLLLLSLESNCLIGPFEDSPVDNKEFAEYDWESYDLTDFSNMIRSKRDTRKSPQVSYAVSGNRRELVSYQDDPATGQHCYYACSKQPIEQWTNLQSGVIENESIDQWKEHGEFEELNRKEFQNSSLDIPRCVVHTSNSEVDFNLNDDQYRDGIPCRCQRIQNSSNNSNCVTPGTSRPTNDQIIHTGRPETPQRFGGMGEQNKPYEIEQFGLSQNEQFFSPRGVFQNLDYDRFQTHRSPMPPRMTDEVIESFENAKHRRGPLSEVKHNNAKQQLCARLQIIRDGMNKKPQVEIDHQIEVEPEIAPYEPIRLEEPSEDTCGHEETEQDLGILSIGDMDDEVLFGDHQTIDPRTIFKTKDENLVSRNVKKIQTNTTINGNKREVTEEVLEQEDVNVVDRTEEEDENLVDVSEPTFQSPTGQSPYLLSDDYNTKKCEQWKSKPRRVFADYSDLPQEDLADISKPSFQQASFCQEQLGRKLQYIPREENRFHSGRQQNSSHKSNLMSERRPATGYRRLDEVSQPDFSVSIEKYKTRLPPQIDVSERLEDVCQPRYASSLEDSISRTLPEQQNIHPINQRPQQVHQSRRIEPSYYVHESERSNNVCRPDCAVKSRISRGMSPHRGLSQAEALERLDEVSQPSFFHSTEISYQDTLNRTRCPTSQRPMPQVETSERLDQVSHPVFLSSIEDPYQDSTKRSRCPLGQRAMTVVDRSEVLDQISHPSFMTSFPDSTVPSRRGRVETSERLDEVSQPGFVHSSELPYHDSIGRTRCPRSQRPMPQIETSEMLDQISHPGFFSSIEDTCQESTARSRCPLSQRINPEVDTSERLRHISQPSRQGRCMSPHKYLPHFETPERLEEVSEPVFLNSKEIPYQCPRRRRPLHQIERSERLDQVSQPVFLSSIEDTYPDSTIRSRCVSRQRDRLDQISHPSFVTSFQYSTAPSTRRGVVDTSEKLDEVSQPAFLHSSEVSYQDTLNRTRCPPSQRPMPKVETSERLDQVSHPGLASSIEDTYQGSIRRTRCPLSHRAMPEVETSERLDQISHPSFVNSFQDSTVPYRQCRGLSPCRRFHQVEASERLEGVSEPRFSHSPEMLCMKPTRRTRCQRPLPPVETSERLEEVSDPSYLPSIEDSRRCKCPLSEKPLSQNKTSEQKDKVSQPSHMSSFRDSSMKSGGAKRLSPCRTLPEVQTRNHLEISHSIGNSRDFKPLQRDISIPKIDDSELLNEVCQSEFQTLYEERSKAKHYLPVDDSEILENICQPEFPFSFEDNLQRSRRQTQDRNSFPQKNVSEKLDDISQPFYPSSFEDSIHRSRENKQEPVQRFGDNVATSGISEQVYQRYSLPREVRNTQPPRLLPLVNESEILDAVIQPDLTSFEDTGYGSKDSLQTVAQSPLRQVEEFERLEDISQPNFQSSYGDSILRSRENKCTQEKRPLPFVNNSERLEDVSQADIPTSFESSIRSSQSTRQTQNIPLTQSVESEKLENVCQPSFQSSFEDSERRPKQIPHLDFQISYQESSNISRRSKQDSRKRLLSRVNTSEILDDISQPFYPSSFEDSMYDQKNRYISKPRPLLGDEESKCLEDNIQRDSTTNRPFPQVSDSDHLDNVTQPVFESYLEGPRHTRHAVSISQRTSQRRPQKRIDTSEKLNDVSQPIFPTSYEDSMKNSERYYKETPKRRPLPNIDVSEKIEDVCHPSFCSSFKDSSNKSRTREQLPMRRPFSQINESEQLDDVSQPSIPPSSFKHSTAISRESRLYPSHADESGKNSFENSKQISVRHGQSLDNRPLPQIDISEKLNDISQPDFATSLENTVSRSMRPLEEKSLNQGEFSKHQSVGRSHPRQQRYPEMDVSERLDDVCQTSFPNSWNDSMRYSRKNKSRPNQESFSREMQQNIDQTDVSSSLERSDRSSRRRPVLIFDTSEMLENCAHPEFPSTFQDSTNVSSERRKTCMERRAMPQIDVSENIESVCQPEFPVSFEDTTTNDMQNVSSTYRKNKNNTINFPKENLADISAPTFHSNCESSMQRRHANFCLPRENLEDVSSPSFQTTPKLPQRHRHREDIQSRGPPRQLFPKQDSTKEGADRPGDFRKVFESMPNYAPFEQQVAFKRNPITSRLKLPVTFDNTMAPNKFHKTEMVYPRPQTQPSHYPEMSTKPFAIPSDKSSTLRTEDIRASRIRPPIKSQVNRCTLEVPTNRDQMEPTVSATRIPLPPSARSQSNIQRQEQRLKIEIPANQERLIKKSSVKFHQTKSTYFKNKQDKSSGNQSRK